MSVTLLYSALHSHLKISNNNNSNNKTTYAPLKAEVKKKNQPPFQVHVCKNVLRCSCDKPFCCASSRCSPPQRRALPRRVAPFSDTREAALLLPPPLCFCYRTPYPCFQPVFPRCSSDVKHKTPPPPIFTAPLPSLSPSEDLALQPSSSCSQKTLHANSRWCDVT